ncbi:MAG TPA: efflux RND transporter periplasmic adaptor subunit [Lunatimonas sp.]|nr:efflux RND transporter periplasmic adaptor subunit [Lunatimonas sp.]
MMKKTTLGVSLLIFLGCAEDKATENQPTIVTVDEAVSEMVVLEQRYPASVVALKEVELRADVVGYITQIQVADGERVRQGQVLYQIDRSRYQAQLDQAQSQLEIARANQARSERDITRYEKLREGNAIAGKIYDDALTDMVSSQQELLRAQAAVDNATTDLGYATIRAPFAGTVGFSSVRLGALVTPGQTLLNVISADDPMGLDFYADEKSLHDFTQLMTQPEKVSADSVFRLLLPNQQLYPFPGSIETIDRAIDRGTGTIQIRLKFPNPDYSLKPGLNTTLLYTKTSPESQITVLQKALVERLGEVYVYVADNGEAKQVTVKTGNKSKDRVVIQEGLQAGQQIVVSGVQKIADGDKIQIKNEN